jgi:ribokinase
MDLVCRTRDIPRPGETILGSDFVTIPGGKGANQAVAARRLGAEVRFIGCVGADASGEAVGAAMAAEGIGVAGLARSTRAPTGTAVIVVDAAGQNQIAVAPAANRHLAPEMLAQRAEDFGWASVVLCQLEVPIDTVAAALEDARRRKLITVLNPAPVRPLPDDLWRLIDYLTPNAIEAGRLSGVDVHDRPSAEIAARALLDRGARAVIVTLGDLGAVGCDARERVAVRAFPIQAVDTTAAGDAFTAALAVAVGEGRLLSAALGFAAAAAALACTRPGAQPSLPTRSEVDALLR